MSSTVTNFDHPWKDVIEGLFPHMMLMLMPSLHAVINWSRPITFLDTELRQVCKHKPGKGRRFVDKLVRVSLKGGGYELLYIHIEIQTTRNTAFPRRMFVYSYRLFEKFGENVVSLAILGDLDANWRPDSFGYGKHGSKTTFKFPMFKLMDFETREAELLESDNPFALVILAHLKAKRTGGKKKTRASSKLQLLRLVASRNWPRKRVEALFTFIDWVLSLPDNLDKVIALELKKDEEVNKMVYVTSWERRAKLEGEINGEIKGEIKGVIKGEIKGEIKGVKNTLVDMLHAKFGEVPAWVREKIEAAELSHVQVWCRTILFKNDLNEIFST